MKNFSSSSPDSLGRTRRPCHSVTMTLKIRRTILGLLLLPTIAAVAATTTAWVLWAGNNYGLEYDVPVLTARWWSSWRPSESRDFSWALVGISFFSIVPLLSEILLRRRFGRSPSPEIFFFRFFLLTLPLQACRLASSPVLTAFWPGTLPVTWGMTMTRIAWFGRFLGISSLLNIGLYSSDVPFRRSGAILGMGALASLAVAVMVPLDATQFLGNMLYRSGAETALALACVSMESLAVLSLVGTAVNQRNSRYYLLAAALILVVAGTDMAFFISQPLMIPGLVLMLIGILSFSREVRKIYQWV